MMFRDSTPISKPISRKNSNTHVPTHRSLKSGTTVQVDEPKKHATDELWTPTQVQQQLEQLVKSSALSRTIFVTGEIMNYSAKSSSGHLYFDLKDEHKNKLSCTLFCVSRVLSADTLSSLDNGVRVVAKGLIRCVSKFKGSQYQLNVRGLQIQQNEDSVHEKQLEEWQSALTQEGVFDTDHKRVLPLYPQRIAVVTSVDGAVLQDIRQTLENARVPVHLVVYPCAVQGKNCVPSVLEQLRSICEQSEDETEHVVLPIDLVLIARGGGSREDLWAFNQPLLLRGIDAMRGVGTLPPIACAIGHQTDTPLLDDVCDASFITPTYAAQYIAQSFVNLQTSTRSLHVRLHGNVRQVLQQMHSRYQVLTSAIQNHSPHQKLLGHTQHLHQHLQTRIHQLLSTTQNAYSRLYYAVHKHDPARATVQHLQNQHARLKQSVQSALHVLSTKWNTLCNTTQNSVPWSLFTHHTNWVMLKDANGMKDMNVFDVITQRTGMLSMVTPYGLVQIKYNVQNNKLVSPLQSPTT